MTEGWEGPGTPFGDPPNATRRKDPHDSLLTIGKHAKESAVAVGKLDLDEVLKRALFEMNGREAVLAYLLSEALGEIKQLELKVSLLLQTAACLVDDIQDVRRHVGMPAMDDTATEENRKEEGK